MVSTMQAPAPAVAAMNGRRPIPPPPKARRRPVLLVAGVLVTVLGALVAATVFTATSNTREVVVARKAIPRGQVVVAGDVVTARVNTDPMVSTVSGNQLQSLIGKTALVDIPDGALLAAGSVGEPVGPGPGQSVIGLNLGADQMPIQPLRPGDTVRVVVTPGTQGEVAANQPVEAIAAVVAGVRQRDENGKTVVDVVLPASQAPLWAARAATGKVALVLDGKGG